jgi:fructose-specific phosphotransferase system IIA component
MGIADYLSEETIKLSLEGSTKEEIIEEMVKLLESSGSIKNYNTVLKDIMERESNSSTGFEDELAIPHGKSDGVDGVVMAFGMKKEGVDFDSLDDRPVKLIFLVVSSKDTSGPHIQALAQITRSLKNNKSLKERLLNCKTPAEVIAIISEFK